MGSADDTPAATGASPLMERAAIPSRIFPPLRQPGEVIGPLLPGAGADAGLAAPVPLVAVGSHDTASAVVGVPARGTDFAYISCGTWSLVGVELDQPVLTDASRCANFTNEVGVDGTIRYLRNVMGCGCCRSRCEPGPRPGGRPSWETCWPARRGCRR